MRLAEALEDTATGALRRMASAHGLLSDDATTRAELIERLGERLLDPTYLDRAARRRCPTTNAPCCTPRAPAATSCAAF